MPKKNKTKNFEEALHRLEELVSQLEHAEAPLETALALYEEGVGLARFCSRQLKAAERRVEILEDKNGRMESRPFLSPDPERQGLGDEIEMDLEDNEVENSDHAEETPESSEEEDDEENEEAPETGLGRNQKNLF
ncbi:exodeoxyribonuclease VII small subunit [bacterium]|nr:exodeoxyribonuclease VII small subunit [bacterium]